VKHQILDDLSLNAQWLDMIKKLELKTPELPSYTPKADNSEQWKYDSGLRDGFLYALNHLKGR